MYDDTPGDGRDEIQSSWCAMWWQRWVPICIYAIYKWCGGAEQNSCRFTLTSLKAKILTVSALWTAVTLDLRKVKDMTLTTMLSSFCQNDLRKPKAAAARGIQALICTNPYSKSNWQKKWPFIKTRKENPHFQVHSLLQNAELWSPGREGGSKAHSLYYTKGILREWKILLPLAPKTR